MNSQTPSLSLISSLQDQTTYSSDECLSQTNTHRCVPQLECTRTYGMEDLNNQKHGQTSILYLINRNSAELSHLQKVFTTFNNYPNKVVANIINTERTQTVTTLNEEDQPLKNNETHAPVCWTKRRIDDEENE